MLQRIFKIALVVTSLFLMQISFANAQAIDEKQFIGEWVMSDIMISPLASKDKKENAETRQKFLAEGIGKSKMIFESNQVYTFFETDLEEGNKGTWKYDKKSKKLIIKESKQETPISLDVAFAKNGELQTTDDITLIVFWKKK